MATLGAMAAGADLAGATHFMFIEEPEEVNAAMLDFLVEAAGR